MEERFGIPQSTWEGYLLFCRRRSWWLLADSSHVQRACRLKVSAVGLKAFEKVGAFVKPTTRFIQVFGKTATKGKIEISEEQFESLKQGEATPVACRIENGYAIIAMGGNIIGLGLLINGVLHSQLRRL